MTNDETRQMTNDEVPKYPSCREGRGSVGGGSLGIWVFGYFVISSGLGVSSF